MRHRPTRLGFTLIELLVVLAIMAVLTGLTLAAVQQVRARAARALCSHRMRQLGLALHQYHGTYGAFPPGFRQPETNDPQPYVSWLARLLPYLEQEALWKQSVDAYAADPMYWQLPPHPYSTIVPAFECPSYPRCGRTGFWFGGRPGMTCYVGVDGMDHTRKDGILFADSQVRLTDVTDGTSQTLAVGERPPVLSSNPPPSVVGEYTTPFGCWYVDGDNPVMGAVGTLLGGSQRNYSFFAPDCPVGPYEFGPGRIDNVCDAFHFWSFHSGGANFVFADGSVRFLSYGAKSVVLALSTRAGGEVVEIP